MPGFPTPRSFHTLNYPQRSVSRETFRKFSILLQLRCSENRFCYREIVQLSGENLPANDYNGQTIRQEITSEQTVPK